MNSTCPICQKTFTADPSHEAAYHASLGKGDKEETKRLLGLINSHWALSYHMADDHPEAMFYCPRGAGPGTPFVNGFDGHAFWEDDRTCSYCGSLSPEAFFEAVLDGAEVGPTDKSYKVYLNGEAAPKVHGAAKFYFQHLSEDQMRRFIELVNNKTMKIGYPGHFYVTPYFCTKA